MLYKPDYLHPPSLNEVRVLAKPTLRVCKTKASIQDKARTIPFNPCIIGTQMASGDANGRDYAACLPGVCMHVCAGLR